MFGAGGEISLHVSCTFVQSEAATYINSIYVFWFLWCQGFGVYNYANKFFRYEGEWSKGKKHGELIITGLTGWLNLIHQYIIGFPIVAFLIF